MNCVLEKETAAAIPVLMRRKCCVYRCTLRGTVRECRRCKTNIHEECYENLFFNHNLDRLQDGDGNDIVLCSKNCYYDYKIILSGDFRCQWYNDGKHGPSDPVSSEAILVKWLKFGRNYMNYCAYPKRGINQLEICKNIAERIKASGVMRRRTAQDVERRIALIETQMQDAFQWERACTAAGVVEGSEVIKASFRKELLRRCRYFDDLAPIFRDNTPIPLEVAFDSGSGSGRALVGDTREYNNGGRDGLVSLEIDDKDSDVELAETVAPKPVTTGEGNEQSPPTRCDATVTDSKQFFFEDLGDGASNGKDEAAMFASDSNDDAINRQKTAAHALAARTKINSRSPPSRRDAPVPTKPHENESEVQFDDECNVPKQSKKRKKRRDSSSHADCIDEQSAAPEISMEINRRRKHQSEIDRLHVARLKLQNEWQEHKNNLRERGAWLDIDLKKIEVARQRLVYRTELDARYRDLRLQQNRSYEDIANLFPEMIELFPPEERSRFNR